MTLLFWSAVSTDTCITDGINRTCSLDSDTLKVRVYMK